MTNPLSEISYLKIAYVRAFKTHCRNMVIVFSSSVSAVWCGVLNCMKSQVLKTNIFELKMMVKSGLEFFYFEILLAPSEIPANLPGQFSLSRQLFLHWAAEGASRISK